MSRYLIKLADDAYVEWSTVVDAPVSGVFTRSELIEQDQADRIERCDKYGHSAMWFGPQTAEELIAGNRAGFQETALTLDEIIEQFGGS
jgi:hypothetical protein